MRSHQTKNIRKNNRNDGKSEKVSAEKADKEGKRITAKKTKQNCRIVFLISIFMLCAVPASGMEMGGFDIEIGAGEQKDFASFGQNNAVELPDAGSESQDTFSGGGSSDSGTGSSEAAAPEADKGSGTGQNTGGGAGTNTGGGAGTNAGSGAGTNAAGGAGAFVGGTGTNTGSGIGTNAGGGTGTNAGGGTSTNTGGGTSTNTGAGAGTNAGGTSTNTGSGAGMNAGGGTSTNTGSGTGINAGSGTGTNRGNGTNISNGTNTNVSTGKGTEKENSSIQKELPSGVSGRKPAQSDSGSSGHSQNSLKQSNHTSQNEMRNGSNTGQKALISSTLSPTPSPAPQLFFYQKKPEETVQESVLTVSYHQEELETSGGPLKFRISADCPVLILSARINQKECLWHWEGNVLVLENTEEGKCSAEWISAHEAESISAFVLWKQNS